MNARDDLLRAHVYRAFALRGTDSFGEACRDVVDGWLMYPALEAELLLERARKEREAREVEFEAWMVETADAVCRV